jgi:hypothetical protein
MLTFTLNSTFSLPGKEKNLKFQPLRDFQNPFIALRRLFCALARFFFRFTLGLS